MSNWYKQNEEEVGEGSEGGTEIEIEEKAKIKYSP